MRNKIARFMYGRNGNDQLNRFLLILNLILLVAASLFKGQAGKIMYLLVLAVLGLVYFRMLSKNVYRRREENEKYIRARLKMSAILTLKREQWVQRKDYKFFTCPSCRAALRVPRGHGKVKMVCRQCGTSFTGKT